MTECILTTEHDSQPDTIEVTTWEDSASRIPDHAIERFAKFLYPRFLADMEQRKKATE